MRNLLFITSRCIGVTLSAAIMLLCIGATAGLGVFMLTPPGWLIWPLVIGYGADFFRRLNRRRAALVLSHVRQAVRLSLPLPEFLIAAARSEPPRTSRQLNDVASAIALGAQVSHALHAGAPQLTDRQATLLLSAERAGNLDAALGMLDQQRRRLDAADNLRQGGLFAYPIMLLAVIAMVTTMVMILIVPKFEKIFDDHGIQFPALTRAMINTSRWMGGRLYPDQIAPGFIFVGMAMFAAMLLFAAFQWQATRRRIAPLLWHLPLLGDGERSGAMADACHTIALWLRAGAPIDRALREASGLAINAALTRRLGRCADLLAQGVPFSDALRQGDFPAQAAGLLASAHATGSLTEAFDFLARYHDHRYHRFAILLRAATAPAVLIVIGAIEAFVVVGLFLPMVALIHNLT